MSNTVYGNYYDKYGSRNPVARLLTNGFRNRWMELLGLIDEMQDDWSLLEVGCADGQFLTWYTERIKHRGRAIGLDPGMDVLRQGSQQFQGTQFVNGSIYELPFPDRAFDIVIAPEVFEHLDDPVAGIEEVVRVASRYVISSVPWEPMWRIVNMMRGSYIRDLGNTPGHLQHFTRRAFVKFIGERLNIIAVRKPFPWTQVLAEVRL